MPSKLIVEMRSFHIMITGMCSYLRAGTFANRAKLGPRTYKTVWFVGPFSSGLTYNSVLPTDFVSIATCVCGIRSYQRSM